MQARPWLDIPGSFVTGDPEDWWTFDEHSPSAGADVKATEPYGALACPEPECTSHDICRLFYQCFFDVLPSTEGIDGLGARNLIAEHQLYARMEELGLNERDTFRCGIIILPPTIGFGGQPACPITHNSQSIADWEIANVDINLQRFIAGGFDTEFVYWLGQAVDGRPFSQALGGQLTKIANYQCSLEIPCAYPYECTQVGSWTAARLGKEVVPSRWGLLALTALRNINQQLTNQYVAIKGALGVLALDTFLISDFFPEANGRFDVLNALTGLGTILSVFSGFVPVIGPGLSAAGAVLPAVGSFLGNSLTSKGDPLVGQKEFAPKVRQLYSDYVDALDSAAATLFKGENVNGTNGTFNITDMMSNGAWADTTSIAKLTGLESNFTIEILSRSIDALWKTPNSNKMWVLFSDLADDASSQRCLADKSGPQSTKYCGDQGVYYTYNFVEDGPERGHVDYPWGGDRLQEKLGIKLTVKK
ncbi:MAG: hypothetical protein L6R42_006853, partial [Xanthoria sp. 1 TBL-2021]